MAGYILLEGKDMLSQQGKPEDSLEQSICRQRTDEENVAVQNAEAMRYLSDATKGAKASLDVMLRRGDSY